MTHGKLGMTEAEVLQALRALRAQAQPYSPLVHYLLGMAVVEMQSLTRKPNINAAKLADHQRPFHQ